MRMPVRPSETSASFHGLRTPARRLTRTQDLAHRIKADDPARLPTIPRLQLKVARRLVLGIEVEESVGIVLENEKVVLAGEGEQLLLALEGRGAAGRVGAGRTVS